MPNKVMLVGRYLGGHPARTREKEPATLVVEMDGVKVKTFKAFIEEPWSSIYALSAEGPDEASKRITATRLLLTGPLALAWRKEKKLGFVVVQGDFGEFIFEVKKQTPQELRAKLAPWAALIPPRAEGAAAPPAQETEPFAAEPAATAPEPSAGLAGEREKFDLLREIGELRASGVLTEEEFEEQKARILSGG